MYYNPEYKCCYMNHDVFTAEEDANLLEEEKDYIRNILYKKDLQNIFHLNQNDITEVDDNDNDNDDDDNLIINELLLPELYSVLKKSIELRNVMKTIAMHHLYCKNEEMGLCLLFSYDYLYLTHECISTYLEKNIIDNAIIQQIMNKMK